MTVDQFPAGLRVLAVDDDSTCLRVLESLLRRCHYDVTTTNQAVVALKLLRDKKNKFDLVISDVHMPDMDGFKLLELVGLEMDLPVIMLSGNSDPKVVMQGISHGACDYLLKPVRMEELRNIWQHVVRRQKLDAKERSGGGEHREEGGDTSGQVTCEGGHGPALSGSSDRNGKLSRKRKDQNEDDDDEFIENAQGTEDSATQKKARVVWNVELHRKFVAAVHQLGIDKAMPKRILDLMNVETLTRENVASHLQKYRLYLKRISTVANQQANMVAALGKDTQFLPMGSLDGLRNYHGFSGSGQLATLASFQQGGMLGRLNSANSQAFYGLGSSGMVQLGRANTNVTTPIQDMGKFPQISFSGTQQVSLIPGIPISLEANQLQQQKLLMGTSGNLLAGSSNSKALVCNSNNPYLSHPPNNIQLVQKQPQQSSGFTCPPPARLAAMSTEFFGTSTANQPDISRCNETWATAAPLSGYTSNPPPQGVHFAHDNKLNTRAGDGLSSIVSSADGNIQIPSSSNTLVPSLTNLVIGRNMQCHVSTFDPNTALVPSNENNAFGLSDIGGACGLVQRWDNQPDQALQQSFQYNSSNTMLDMTNNSMSFSNGMPNRMVGAPTMNQSNASSPFLLQNPNIERSDSNDQREHKQHSFDPANIQGGLNPIAYSNTFDELMSAIVKRERDDILIDGDVSCDLFSLETCM